MKVDMMADTGNCSSDVTTDHHPQNDVDHDDERNHITTTATVPTTTIVLFYKYFLPSSSKTSHSTTSSNEENNTRNPSHNNNTKNNVIHDTDYYYIQNHSDFYLDRLRQHIQHLCTICHIPKGRILIATEGINGTISATHPMYIQQFISQMKSLDIIQQFGLPPSLSKDDNKDVGQLQERPTEFLFQNIDWKISTATNHGPDRSNSSSSNIVDPFPDLKISIVNEIISTGNNAASSTSETSTTPTSTSTNTSTTGITLQDMVQYGGGIHLSPTEFHNMIERDNVVLFDIRNTFEYQIGHFVHPRTQESAIHPKDMVQFSTLPSILQQTIFNNNSNNTNNDYKTDTDADANGNHEASKETKEQQLYEELHNKKILLYCTGGIRCEKASVMFQKFLSTAKNNSNSTDSTNDSCKSSDNHTNVYQLSGGIHRYIEQYGSSGYFKGKNFVFDQRIVQHPSDYDNNDAYETSASVPSIDRPNESNDDPNIVGQCVECTQKYDTLCGSRICTVCRDLVLVCSSCQTKFREYHCSRHQRYKTCYFTFLEVYTIDELQHQYDELSKLRDGYLLPQKQPHKQQPTLSKEQLSKKYKNIRRTLHKQMMKINERIHDLEIGIVQCDQNAVRRCRTCFEPNTICDGKCWGFWKRSFAANGEDEEENTVTEPMLPMLTIGTMVEPGPHWNESRFGSKYERLDDPTSMTSSGSKPQTHLRQGCVVDVKTWGSNSTEYDCVAVSWNATSSSSLHNSTGKKMKAAPLIYRWGVIARNGQRMYDLQRVENA